ncbi:MAG: endonuclease Q family protein [Candidatus Hodarchaeota archaeon]
MLEIAIDLHAHSIFAGGTQGLKISPEKSALNRKKAISRLNKTNETMPLKGIKLIGTGDCQFETWMDILHETLIEETNGVFYLKDAKQVGYILQTEIIFTIPIGRRSKVVHVVFLFPDYTSIETFQGLLDKWEVKHKKMARPFIKCISPNQVSDRIFTILDIDTWIEAIPAHIMTPQGVFGSNIRINHLNEFFGAVASELQVFETGLSADPEFLVLIPELDDRVLISCSDAHSGALHRMGREYTVLSVSKIDYPSIISALRRNQVILTAEFPPEEGRFFLTGHRSGRKAPGIHGISDYCYFSPQHVPVQDICPICSKTLTIGVFQRCVEISRAQGVDRKIGDVEPLKNFVRMVPLIDIIAHVQGIKTKTSKSIIAKYHHITSFIGPERNIWQLSSEEVGNKLEGKIETRLLEAILQVKAGNFTFHPYGFDGVYGTLKIGQKGNYKDVKVINSSKPIQKTL